GQGEVSWDVSRGTGARALRTVATHGGMTLHRCAIVSLLPSTAARGLGHAIVVLDGVALERAPGRRPSRTAWGVVRPSRGWRLARCSPHGSGTGVAPAGLKHAGDRSHSKARRAGASSVRGGPPWRGGGVIRAAGSGG